MSQNCVFYAMKVKQCVAESHEVLWQYFFKAASVCSFLVVWGFGVFFALVWGFFEGFFCFLVAVIWSKKLHLHIFR